MITTEPIDDPILRQAQEGAAQASLADAANNTTNFSLTANSHHDNIVKAEQQRTDYFTKLSKLLFGLILLVPLVAGILTAVSAWKSGKFWQKAGLMLLLGGFSFVFLVGLVTIIDEFFWRASENIFSLMGLSIVISFIGLVVISWRNKDKPLGWILALSFLFIPLLFALTFASDMGDFYPNDALHTICHSPLIAFTAFFPAALGRVCDGETGITAVATLLVAIGIFAVPVAGMSLGAGGGTAEMAAFAPGQTVEVTRVVTETIVELVEVEVAAEEMEEPMEEADFADAAELPRKTAKVANHHACANTSQKRCFGCPMAKRMKMDSFRSTFPWPIRLQRGA